MAVIGTFGRRERAQSERCHELGARPRQDRVRLPWLEQLRRERERDQRVRANTAIHTGARFDPHRIEWVMRFVAPEFGTEARMDGRLGGRGFRSERMMSVMAAPASHQSARAIPERLM